ncbi:MAG: hypothetical protein ACLUUG_12775 [Lachnospiraceae bacterium]
MWSDRRYQEASDNVAMNGFGKCKWFTDNEYSESIDLEMLEEE